MFVLLVIITTPTLLAVFQVSTNQSASALFWFLVMFLNSLLGISVWKGLRGLLAACLASLLVALLVIVSLFVMFAHRTPLSEMIILSLFGFFLSWAPIALFIAITTWIGQQYWLMRRRTKAEMTQPQAPR